VALTANLSLVESASNVPFRYRALPEDADDDSVTVSPVQIFAAPETDGLEGTSLTVTLMETLEELSHPAKFELT
jgi:hypothetical protein